MTFDRAARRFADWAKALLDESVPADHLRGFLTTSLAAAESKLAAGPFSLPPPARRELAQARALASRLGLLPEIEATHVPDESTTPPVPDAEAWLAALPDGKVVGRRGLVAGAGEALRSLLEKQGSPARASLTSALEALLRHVETRRRDGLCLSSPPKGTEPWMEWLAVAVLFSCASRQQRDLRLLNAAFKLNDWAYPEHRRLPLGPRLARYLLSVAEAEAAAAERLA
jgi:hypothetical protein